MSFQASSSPVDSLLGVDVGGRYRLHRIIGTGGMGTVYEATQLSSQRRCAVKVLLRELMTDQTYMERFRREAEITSRLHNAHIAEVMDFNYLPDGAPYLVMEYLEGEDLASRLEHGGPLSPVHLAPIVDGVTQAMDAAHTFGVLHRDIKPANLFLAKQPDGSEIVKLLDFGASKMKGRDANLTAFGQVIGSVNYVSPEQARGQDLDPRTDVFSLGIVIYEALTGHNPFEAGSPTEVLFKIVSDPFPSILAWRPSLPPALQGAIERALAKKREDRFESGAALAAVLLPILDPSYGKPALRTLSGSPFEARGGPDANHDRFARAAAEASQGQELLAAGVLDSDGLRKALALERVEGVDFLDRIISAGLADERTILRFLVRVSGRKYLTRDTLHRVVVEADVQAKLPLAQAKLLDVLPLAYEPATHELTIATAEDSPSLIDQVRIITGAARLQVIITLRSTIRGAIRSIYEGDSTMLHSPERTDPEQAALPDVDPVETPLEVRVDQELPEAPPPPAPGPNGADKRQRMEWAQETLIKAKLLDKASAVRVRAALRKLGGDFVDTALRMGLVKEADVLRAFAERHGMRFVRSEKVVKVGIAPSLLEQIPAAEAEALQMIPIARNPELDEVHVVAATPPAAEVEPTVRRLTGAAAAVIYLATPGVVAAAIRRWYYGDIGAFGELENGAGPPPTRKRPTTEPSNVVRVITETVDIPKELTSEARPARSPDPSLPALHAVGPAQLYLLKRLPLQRDREMTLSNFLRETLELMGLERVALQLASGKTWIRSAAASKEPDGIVPQAIVDFVLADAGEGLVVDPAVHPELVARSVGGALAVPLRFGSDRAVFYVESSRALGKDDLVQLSGLAELLALRLDDLTTLEESARAAETRLSLRGLLPPLVLKQEVLPSLDAGGLEVEVTLLVAELRGLAEMAGQHAAAEAVALVRKVHEALSPPVRVAGGALSFPSADQLVAVWGVGGGLPEDAVRAVASARAMQQRSRDLGGLSVPLAIGLHSARLVLGTLGPPDQTQPMLFGPERALAFRLASLALDGQTLAGEAVVRRLGNAGGLRPIPLSRIQSLGDAQTVYLIGANAPEEIQLG